MQVWIVEFIYDDAGVTRIRTAKVNAPDYDTARGFALGDAPAGDFVMSLYPQSDDQFLEQVTVRAHEMAGRTVSDVPDPDDDIDEDDS
ncbi:MAG: hypothetical protein ABID63_01560 [Pseudomonadota bacterium]